MIQHSRRTLPAVLVAATLLTSCVVVAVSCVQSIAGRPVWLPFSAVNGIAAGLTARSPWVIGLGGLVALAGLLLVMTAARRGPVTVLPLAGSHRGPHKMVSGVTRRSLTRALRAEALTVDGVDAVGVQITGQKLRFRVRTPVRDYPELGQDVEDAVRVRLDTIGLSRQPSVRVRVRARKRKGA